MADFSAHLRTSGDWDTHVDIYLTDDHTNYANVSFDGTFRSVIYDGQELEGVGAWTKIVQGAMDEDGAVTSTGEGSDFMIHFNVDEQSDNAGLLRHEMMHGFGAVGTLPWFSMSEADELGGVVAGEQIRASIYDLQLVDLDGNFLMGDYDAATGMFEVQEFSIEQSLDQWMDGDGGLLFRGRDADGFMDMSLITGPGNAGGLLRMNKILDVMSAGAHPTWATIEEPDLRFFRAMGCAVVEE
ncbi:MAG: hypothetical protein GY822_01530 [Deltaproteobacteria bacterium]|nr:hypothetical protein [Deltaproteobacteria bacterium]